ncbi:hypothetical protein D3C72_2239310 [compost metagenome]
MWCSTEPVVDVAAGARSAASVPRAGEMISPETPCSRMDATTSRWRSIFSLVLARNWTKPADCTTVSTPTASSAKKLLVRSLTTIPMIFDFDWRRLAALRL